MAKSQEIAQIEEINKGLTTLNSTLSTTSESYLRLVKTISDGNKEIKDNAVSFENLAKAQKQTADEGKKLDALDKQVAQTELKLKQLEDDRVKTIIQNRAEIQKRTQAIKDQVKADQAAEGSLVSMRARLKELTTAYDNAGVRTKEAAKEIDNLSREIGKAEAATNRHGRGVGGYADQLGRLPGFAGQAGQAIGTFTKSAEGAGKALKTAFLTNPITIVIAAIIAVVGGLVSIFKKFEPVVEAVSKALSGIKAVFSAVSNTIIGLVTGQITLKEAFSGLGKSIKQAYDEGVKWKQLQKDILDMTNINAVLDAKRKTQMDELLLASRNRTKSEAERSQLIDQTLLLEEVQFNERKKIADAEVLLQRDKMIAGKNFTESEKKELDKRGVAYAIEMQKKKNISDEEIKAYSDSLVAQEQLNNEDIALREKAMNRQDQINEKGEAKRQKELDRAQKVKDELRKQDIEWAKEQDAFIEKTVAGWEKEADEKWNSEVDLQRKIFEQNRKAGQEEYDAKVKEEEKKKELAEKMAEQIKEIQLQMADEVVSAVFNMNAVRLDNELRTLDKEKEAKLSNKNLTEKQKAKIETEYEQKSNVIKTKQAKADKLQALFGIAIDTAKGSMKAISESPLTFGLPFLPWVIAMGLLQAGLVAAQPIPKYAKGTKSANDKGIFGEAGRELMFLKSGDIAMAEKPTYFEGSKFKGAKIYSNPETERMMKMTDMKSQGYGMTDERLVNELRDVKKAILNKPIMIVDKEHKPIGQGTSNAQTIYLNKLLRN